MDRKAMLNIIEKHNDMVSFIGTLENIKVSADVIFKLMPLSCKMASLGLALTQEARAMNINAVVCMQSGKITVDDKFIIGKLKKYLDSIGELGYICVYNGSDKFLCEGIISELRTVPLAAT
jgi:hypothetical protein